MQAKHGQSYCEHTSCAGVLQRSQKSYAMPALAAAVHKSNYQLGSLLAGEVKIAASGCGQGARNLKLRGEPDSEGNQAFSSLLVGR